MEFAVLFVVVPRERVFGLRGNAECEDEDAVDLLHDFGFVGLELVGLGAGGGAGDLAAERGEGERLLVLRILGGWGLCVQGYSGFAELGCDEPIDTGAGFGVERVRVESLWDQSVFLNQVDDHIPLSAIAHRRHHHILQQPPVQRLIERVDNFYLQSADMTPGGGKKKKEKTYAPRRNSPSPAYPRKTCNSATARTR